MSNKTIKETIINETMRLIEKSGNKPEDINFREICANLNISLGLINYHFKSKQNLINACATKIVDGIVSSFEKISDGIKDLTPYEKLKKLSIMTLDYLFNNQNLSKLSITIDTQCPKINDNTAHTIRAYVPLIKLCKPELNEKQVRFLTYNLVFTMQNLFTRAEIIGKEMNVNLFNKEERDNFHNELLSEIIGE